MVTRLLQAGYPLVAWNRSRIANSPAEAVLYADMSLRCWKPDRPSPQ